MNRNPDGWGIMALINGVPTAVKGGVPTEQNEKGKKTPEYEKFFFDAYEQFKDEECAIHFRIKTHGNIDEENTHPYKVGDNTYLMHNGTMTNLYKYQEKEHSDTWQLAQLIAEMVDNDWLRNESFNKMLKLITDRNRILFLDKEGFWLPDKTLWTNKDGVLYSNDHGIEQLRPPIQTFGGATGQQGTGNTGNNRGHGYPHHGHTRHSTNQTSIIKNDTIPDQNRGDVFLLNGTRIIRCKVTNSPTSKNTLEPVQEKKVMTALPPPQRPESESSNPKEVESGIKEYSFDTVLPKSLKDWKELSLTTIEDLLLEEPEQTAEAIYELVHG